VICSDIRGRALPRSNKDTPSHIEVEVGENPAIDAFTLSGTSEAENTSSSLPKPLDISGQLFSSIPSQYIETNRTSRLLLSIISAKSR
jgi:hypothetical protein